jgi:hypothetical protein
LRRNPGLSIRKPLHDRPASRGKGMIIGRIIGWLLVLAALVVLVADLIARLDTGHFAPTAAGQLWFEISPSTLELAQAGVQRHLVTWLWDPVMQTVLLWPAALVLGVPGVALLWACRRRDRRRRRR